MRGGGMIFYKLVFFLNIVNWPYYLSKMYISSAMATAINGLSINFELKIVLAFDCDSF